MFLLHVAQVPVLGVFQYWEKGQLSDKCLVLSSAGEVLSSAGEGQLSPSKAFRPSSAFMPWLLCTVCCVLCTPPPSCLDCFTWRRNRHQLSLLSPPPGTSAPGTSIPEIGLTQKGANHQNETSPKKEVRRVEWDASWQVGDSCVLSPEITLLRTDTRTHTAQHTHMEHIHRTHTWNTYTEHTHGTLFCQNRTGSHR